MRLLAGRPETPRRDAPADGRRRYRGGRDATPPALGGRRAPHGFFYRRAPVDIDIGDTGGRLAEYPNVSRLIGVVVSSGKASYRDLDEWLSVEDGYDILEVISVDAHNERILSKRNE